MEENGAYRPDLSESDGFGMTCVLYHRMRLDTTLQRRMRTHMEVNVIDNLMSIATWWGRRNCVSVTSEPDYLQ